MPIKQRFLHRIGLLLPKEKIRPIRHLLRSSTSCKRGDREKHMQLFGHYSSFGTSFVLSFRLKSSP